MAEVSNELLYEVLKAIRGDVATARSEIREVKNELQAIRGHMLATHQDVANIYAILGEQGRQVDRINRRLDLADA
ncbi:hypothetical protein [Methylobrevis albus]|uniref:Uncharacterized protein n=1 Tax=Methylobrevis albus TaxID=2793297 RepID=A0A931MXI1_9HYPH|nr:hypothetical protein [Methylobrevis albus]MBH0236905.1 hypothetical protein [Methylobrevis albus]